MAKKKTNRPGVLHLASTERKEATWAAYGRADYVLAIYLGGLAVECILQAIALLDDQRHDARHDLTRWLAKCRTSLQQKVKDEAYREHWNLVCRVWRNELRYLSRDGLLGYLRDVNAEEGLRISGGPDVIMKVSAKRLLDAATAIHNCGVVAWDRYTRK